ncbi:hypothetical protein MHY1_02874 [Methylovirgula sp. HY1]|nr:hypothetical protein MHY1_02874 [Methylovirgula sp. HY1]
MPVVKPLVSSTFVLRQGPRPYTTVPLLTMSGTVRVHQARSLAVGIFAVGSIHRESTILAVRKNLFDVLPPVQHANDLGRVIHDPIENNMRASCK